MMNKKIITPSEILNKPRYSKFQDFRELMKFRVRDILLISSLYDYFIFEEDGRLYELIRKEYHGLNLNDSPELIHCSNGKKALHLIEKEERFNLIIVTQHFEGMTPIELAEQMKKIRPDIPVVHIGYDNREMNELLENHKSTLFENIFVWQGDYRLIIGIIKSIEDKYNIENDTKSIGVQVILLVEDNIRFYSTYLPRLYNEVLIHTQLLISEGVNLSHKFLRMRARPKIIHCTNYEEAWEVFKKYEKDILGVISDINFWHKGKKDPKAGLTLTKNIKKRHPDIPVLLQSNDEKKREIAYSLQAGFLNKSSPTLIQELERFIRNHFGFGDFIFRTENGNEEGRAKNLIELERELHKVSIESIIYHSKRNHFSNWLKARTEFQLAKILRPQKLEDFDSPEELRTHLIQMLHNFLAERKTGVVVDFHPNTLENLNVITRIGSGSIGGKARGIAFISYLMKNFLGKEKFSNVEIRIPTTVILGTDVFDDFLDANNLRDFAITEEDDEKIKARFLSAQNFPIDVSSKLFSMLDKIREPIAVRSSSLLEDSQGEPLAGVYDTFMLPNYHSDIQVRHSHLLTAIKLIYASIFSTAAKGYLKATSYRLEEEKMAVIIQKLVGNIYENRFYPEISGVAKSLNFYPPPPIKPKDGIVSVALGLGSSVVDGEKVVSFCPKYPEKPLYSLTTKDLLNYSQTKFYALKLYEDENVCANNCNQLTRQYDLTVAEKDETLNYVASTYSIENDVIYDGISRPGVRLVTFAPILKHKIFPLPEIINYITVMGKKGMGSEVEIEFAVKLSVPPKQKKEFYLLQIRPFVVNEETEKVSFRDYYKENMVVYSEYALGNGIQNKMKDIVFVDIDTFDRSKSKDAAEELAVINSKLRENQKEYLLIGVGRWGSTDPWLGIPVTWDMISNARIIVESNFRDLDVTPSQGSHFFQNITAFKVGYLTVDVKKRKGFIDWEWLREQKPKRKMKYVTHFRLKKPITVKIDGHTNKGVILKPGTKMRKNEEKMSMK
jgi:CheY-like chemotaxis protein